jgi:hypothetical protein
VLRPDGSIRRVRVRTFPLCDATGEPRYLAGIAEEITDSNQASDGAAESHTANPRVTDASADMNHEIPAPATTQPTST